MDMSTLMPVRMHPTKKKPCCNGRKKAAPWLDGTLNTEYKNEFVDKEVPVQRAGPRNDGLKPTGKFDASTTYGGDFKHFITARPGPCVPLNSQQVETLPFNGESNYKQNFGPKAVPYERHRPPASKGPNTGEFYGDTTYGGDFVPRGVPQPAKMVQRAANHEKTGPFQGESLYKSTFVKMSPAQRSAMVPGAGGQLFPKGDFDDGTMYRSNFVPKEVGRPEQFRPQDSKPMNEAGWFDGIPSTENRSQFVNKEVPAVQAAKPLRGGDVLPKGQLDPSTTYGGAFKQYATAPARAVRPADANDTQKLPFNGVSSYATAFIPKAVPYSRVRPVNSYEPNGERFDGSTTHKAAFQAYQQVPAHRAGPQYQPRESHPFEGTTTYNNQFTKKGGAQRAPHKAAANAFKTGPFDGTTTYRKDFVEKEIPAWEPDCVECSSCDEEEDYSRRL